MEKNMTKFHEHTRTQLPWYTSKKKSLKDELWPKNSGEHYIYQTGHLGLSWIWVEYSKFYKYCQCRNNTSKCIKKKRRYKKV